MNEQQRYEKHLAEKFQQLPVPDVEPHWQQMKWLLDKEMPRGGGYWRWITGVGILLLMLGGTWLFISRNDGEIVAATTAVNQSEIPRTDLPPAPAKLSDNTTENKNKPMSENKRPSEKNNDPLSNETKSSIDETLLNTDQRSETKPGQPAAGIAKQDIGGKINSDQKLNPEKINVPKRRSGNGHPQNNADDNSHDNRVTTSDNRITRTGISDKSKDVVEESSNFSNEYFIKRSAPRYHLQNAESEFAVNMLAGENIKQDYSVSLAQKNAENLKGQKSVSRAKAVRSKALAAVENRTLALGLSLPMGFPLGDQQPGAYNMNAKPNRVSDFLPVPHLQYHLNSKVYLQTELQLMNPQFIQPVLLYQNRTEYPSTNSIHYNSVYAKKLYYFNLPVGIHYSPFEHFYLGTGLQFSSLVSGVAMQEETSFVIGSGTNSLLSQRYSKFKNDSISNRIDNSEFRLMLDANYYWKQFTVGLRYNQALSNYVSFRLNNVTPLFQDKNKSLQFYLRYNLWEKYKRR